MLKVILENLNKNFKYEIILNNIFLFKKNIILNYKFYFLIKNIFKEILK